MFGSKSNYDANFFFEGEQLSGVNSVDINYSNAANVSNPLGYHLGAVTAASPTTQNVSFSRSVISSKDYTLGRQFSGSLNYQGSSYGFQSGFVSNVSVNCAVGTIPTENVSVIVYDELSSGVNASGEVTNTIRIPSQGSIVISSDNVSSNRVIGFDYNVQANYKPYYTIGSKTADSVEYIGPATYNATVQLEVDDVMPQSSLLFLTQGKNGKDTVSLTINGRDGTNIQNYPIPSAVLVSEQLSATADGSLRLTLNYIGHQ